MHGGAGGQPLLRVWEWMERRVRGSQSCVEDSGHWRGVKVVPGMCPTIKATRVCACIHLPFSLRSCTLCERRQVYTHSVAFLMVTLPTSEFWSTLPGFCC